MTTPASKRRAPDKSSYHIPRRVDVARMAGVSIAAVSQVLSATPGARISADTARRIRECAATLGYVPSAAARALKRGRSDALGVMLCSGNQLFNTYGSGIVEGIWKCAVAHGLRMVVDTIYSPDGVSTGDVSKFYKSGSADGIVLISPGADVREYEDMVNAGYPLVTVGDALPLATDYVDIDNFQTGHDAVKYLIDCGHREIALVNGPDEYGCAAPRREGARQALAEAGLAPAGELQCVFNAKSGQEVMAAFLAGRPRFTAVMCASDDIACGAMAAMQRAGLRVPEDVAVIGIDGMQCDNPLFPLATMRQPLAQIGKIAAEMLLERIAVRCRRGAPPTPRTVLLPAELVPGPSVRPLPKRQ